MPQLDEIRLEGLRVFGHHGVFDHERENGQDFVIDLVLSVSAERAAQTDDVADTVHYGEVADAVAQIVAGDPVNLIETLAEHIAEARALPAPTQTLDFSTIASRHRSDGDESDIVRI